MLAVLDFLMPFLKIGLPILAVVMVIREIHKYLTLLFDYFEMTPEEWAVHKAEFDEKQRRYANTDFQYKSPDYTTDPGYHYLYENVHHKDN